MKKRLLGCIGRFGFLLSAVCECGFGVDFPLTPVLWLVIASTVFAGTAAHAVLTTNSWYDNTSNGTYKWETGSEWSLGVPPSLSQSCVMITNGFSIPATVQARIVSIDATTVFGFANTLTISNLVMSSPTFLHKNELQLNNVILVPLAIEGTMVLSNNSVLSMSNSILRFNDSPNAAIVVDGAVLLNSGTIDGRGDNRATAASVGSSANGSWSVFDGTCVLSSMALGVHANMTGTLNILGGSNDMVALYLGDNPTGTGTLWMTDGFLSSSNINLGDQGVGQATISNGTCLTTFVNVGGSGWGTLTFAGGTISLPGNSQIFVEGQGGNSQFIMSGGTMMIATGTFPFAYIGTGAGTTGSVVISGGQLIAPNYFIGVGGGLGQASGQINVSGGLVSGPNIALGYPATSHAGTFTVSGGTCDLSGLDVASANFSGGSVWLTGGQLLVSNYVSDTTIGDGSYTMGQMTVSNGLWLTVALQIGFSAFATGNLTIVGGTNIVYAPQNGTGSPFMHVGREGGLGFFWMNGGTFIFTNGTTTVGDDGGYGQIVVSNGNYISKFIFLGDSAASNCVMNLYGGTTTIYSNLNIGRSDCQAVGLAMVAGGTLYVTNALHNAALDVEDGTFTLNSGTVIVDRFVMTNACANFVRTGGTLIYGSATLNPNLDADGDGFINQEETQAGTDPLDPSSTPFRITSVVRQGMDIVLSWVASGGTTSQVQVTSGTSDGSYITNGFANLGAPIVIGGSGLATTTYTDSNGATNVPARYYRVRFVP